MDFRDSTYTEFDGDGRWIKCFEKFPQVNPITHEEGWYVGKIHSHHNMSVFHSGTDTADLYDNAPKLPLFLSVIVNYACEVDAKVAIAAEAEEITYKSLKWQLKNLLSSSSKRTKQNSKQVSKFTPAVIINCDVSYRQDAWFVNQIEAVKKLQRERDSRPTYTPPSQQHQIGFHRSGYGATEAVKKYETTTIPMVMKNVSELFTLGGDDKMLAYDALLWINTTLFDHDKEKYTKAFIAYFINYWYPGNFHNTSITEEQCLKSLRTFVGLWNTMWINKILTHVFNELEAKLSELWQIQGSGVV